MNADIGSVFGTNSLTNIYSNYSAGSLRGIVDSYDKVTGFRENIENGFDSVFQSALDLVNQTNEYSNVAEEEELNYAMGLSEDTHTLMVAQAKATTSLQYTVAIRDAVIDAYNEIMNMQF